MHWLLEHRWSCPQRAYLLPLILIKTVFYISSFALRESKISCIKCYFFDIFCFSYSEKLQASVNMGMVLRNCPFVLRNLYLPESVYSECRHRFFYPTPCPLLPRKGVSTGRRVWGSGNQHRDYYWRLPGRIHLNNKTSLACCAHPFAQPSVVLCYQKPTTLPLC